MKAVMEIVLLLVFAIGMASVLRYFAKQAANFFGRNSATKGASIEQAKYVRVGHGNVLTNIKDLPGYKGETGLFGLPRYRDVIVPDKHNYATVVYMDHPAKQYVYDLMVTWKKLINPSRDNKYGLLAVLAFLALPFLYNKWLGVVIFVAFALLVLILGPRGKRAVRCSAENAKDFTPETWREIYRDVATSIEREDEMGRAYSKSGTLKHWYGDRNWAGKRW